MCERTYASEKDLNKHKLKHVAPRIKCKECDFTCIATHKSVFYNHSCTNGKFSFKTNTCDVCNITFKAGKKLLDHLNEAHREMLPIPCPHCSTRFTCIRTARLHVTRVHEGNTCEICGKHYANSYRFKAHMAKHEST